MARPALLVHGGAGPVPVPERSLRQASVERALEAGWARISDGALGAAVAAVRAVGADAGGGAGPRGGGGPADGGGAAPQRRDRRVPEPRGRGRARRRGDGGD